MANEIRGLVVHKFDKMTHEKGSIVPRASAMGIAEPEQRLVDILHTLYADKSGKGYGKFEDDEDTYPMQRRVRAYYADKTEDFYAFSIAAMNILKGKADDAPLTTGGYVLIAHLSNGVRDFLLFALVTDTVGSAITEKLDIEDRAHVDLKQFRLAGRIDLTGWSTGEERYIGFLKGPNTDKISDYFRHFLGCDFAVLPRAETRKLVSALTAFANDHIVVDAERDEWLQRVVDICENLAKTEQPFIIEAFSNEMWPQAPELVRAVLADEKLQLSDGFVPDKAALKPLVKFKAITKLWKLEFDRKAISTGDVHYDSEGGTLTLRNLPEALKKELDANDE